MLAAARAIPILLSMSICWRDTKGTASARRGRAPPCTRWIFPELANSRRSRRIVSSETLYRLLRSAARTRPSLPSSSRMYWWRSSFRAIWPASASGFILAIARIHLVMHVYTCIIRLMHDTAKRSVIQGLSQKRSVRAVVFDYGNVLCLEQTPEDMKGMALVCGIPHERFSELYWKLRPPYDRGDIDGPAYWTAVVGQQELSLSSDQIATLIKLDSESITRPNQSAVQWAKLLHQEGFPLALLSNMPLELSRHVTKSFPSLSTFEYLIYSCDYGSIKPELAIFRNCLELLKAAPQDILYLDDRAENLEAAARLGINSVLFDTVEKTASRVESQFDIPVPSYGRCRQSSSQYSSTNRRPDRMESD